MCVCLRKSPHARITPERQIDKSSALRKSLLRVPSAEMLVYLFRAYSEKNAQDWKRFSIIFEVDNSKGVLVLVKVHANCEEYWASYLNPI